MPTVEQLERFLRRVDGDFPVPLSHKQDLGEYACKLREKATLCAVLEEGEILSLAAGYTQNLAENKAYIAIVATLPEGRGRGLAPKLIREFLNICREKQICAVHLYAVPSNIPAMKMYKKMGFQKLALENEPRPEDAHLIYYLEDSET